MNQDVICPYKTVPDILEKRALEMPDKTYLYFADKEWSYRQFHEITNQAASSLKKLGLKKRKSCWNINSQFS